MTRRLTAIKGPLAGAVYELDVETSLGREPTNQIVVRDSAVSRRHCVITLENGADVLVDNSSRHGTLVNGRRIERRPLEEGDRVSIGRSVFVYASGDNDGEGAIALEVTSSRSLADSSLALPLTESRFLRPQELLPALAGSPRLAEELETIRRISAAVRESRQLDELANRVLEGLFEVVPAERGAILLLPSRGEPTAEELNPESVFTHGRAIGPERRLRVSRTVAARVLTERTALLSNGVRDDRALESAESLLEARVRSVLCVPLGVLDTMIGVIYLDSSDPAGRFEPEHLELVTAIAGFVAAPLSVAQRAAELVAVDDAELMTIVAGDELPAHSADSRTRSEVALLLRPDRRLDLGRALMIDEPISALDDGQHRTSLLFLDYLCGFEPPPAGLPGPWLDRLAVLPASVESQMARASSVPSIARLGTVLAATLKPRQPIETDVRMWFQDVLLAAALVVVHSSHVLIEPEMMTSAPEPDTTLVDGWQRDPSAELELARQLASVINKAVPDSCLRPSPLTIGYSDYLSLDGRGPMGISDRGAIYVDDPPDTIAKKIRSAKTDARPAFVASEELAPAVRNLLLLYVATSGEHLAGVLDRFDGQGYGELKNALVDSVDAYLAPLRVRRAELAERSDLMRNLERGSAALDRKGRELAELLSRSPSLVG